AVIAYYYASESSPAGPMYRALLILLRLTTIGLVLLMLSELFLTSSERGRPSLYVVIDASASMNLPAVDDNAAPSRLEAPRQLLLGDDAALLGEWLENYALQLTTAADGSAPLAGTDVETLSTTIAEIKAEGPEANRTRLGDALQRMVSGGDHVP